MSSRKQWIAVIMVILILDMLAIYLSNVTGNIASSELSPFTVSEVFSNSLLGDYVYVQGKVTEVLEDHVSKKGFVYQEFIISDGNEEIKVFCSDKF